MRPRLVIIVVALLLAVSGGTALAVDVLPDGSGDRAAPQPAPAPPPPAPQQVPPRPRLDLTADVSVDIDGFLTWAALDRTTGAMVNSGDEVNTTESMIKAWISADHLRRQAEAGVRPTRTALDEIRRAIRNSDSAAAEALYRDGGRDAVVRRMIEMCGLTGTTIYPSWWSRTEMTAVDAVRMGECLVEGTAAGPEWTGWLLEEMRHVQGSTAERDQRPQEDFEGGRWGIIDGLPPGVDAEAVSIKNGWTRIGSTGSWHLNCLAVTDDWVLAVLMRYPAGYSLDYGARRCASVAAQLFRSPPAMMVG